MSRRNGRVASWAGIVTLCVAGMVFAHSGNVLDFESLETYVAQQDAATATGDKTIHKAWVKLDKALAKDAKGKLSVDLAKLATLSKSANSTLVADGQLRTLLDTLLESADAKLATRPDDVATLIGQIKLQKNRDNVLKIVTAANALRAAAKAARDGGDEAGEIKSWKKADASFTKAVALARQIIKKQGGPLPQFKTAQAGRVYTVVGQGQGGFNGNGLEARRSELYSVQECRFGPDGRLYILDWNNHRIRVRTADGRLEPICGSGTPGDSEGEPAKTDLNHMSSIAFEPTSDGTLGKIYIAAWHNHKVKVYDPTGGPDPRYTGNGPRVYTISGTTQGGGIVNNVDTSGDGGLATSAKYNLMPGIVRLTHDTALGFAGDLLTIDAANETVRRVNLSHGQLAANLVGTQVFTGTVTRVAGTLGQTGVTGDGGPATSCTMNFSKAQNAEPDGRMELTPDGTKVYIINGQGNCIRLLDLNTGIISRFAGTGTAGYSGDGGPAVDAALNRPADVAVAPDGTVYISDSFNNVIRKVTTDGNISTYAGASDASSGTAGDDIAVADAKFHTPTGLELDANGNLYVCDRENNVIRVITSPAPGTTIPLPVEPYVIPEVSKGGPPAKSATGTIATYAGHAPDTEGAEGYVIPHLGFNGDAKSALDTDLYWPQDVAVDTSPLGLLHVVDWNNHRIRRIESNGKFTTEVGSGLLGDQGGEGPDAKLNHPTEISFHPVTGDLWIAAWHTDKILRLDQNSGAIIYMAGNKRAFSGDGAAASNPITGSPTVGVAQMNIPSSVKFTSNGDWYVCDQGNERIRKVDGTTDIINTIVGDGIAGFAGDNGPGLSAEINLPVGQAAQPAGRLCISPDEHWLYLADTGNNRIRRIDLTDAQHTITTYAGTGTPGFNGDGGQAALAELDFPTDVDCDEFGNLYIADQNNNAIRKVDAVTHVITRFAGNGSGGFSGDGGPATEARLLRPSGLFVVRSGATKGRVYVADTYNSVIRVIWE